MTGKPDAKPGANPQPATKLSVHARSFPRLALGASLAVVAAIAMPARLGLALRLVASWDVAAIVLCGLGWIHILSWTSHETRAHAASEDPGRAVVSLIWLTASTVSLVATAVLLRRAKACPPDLRTLLLAFGMFAVASAWFVTHTIFTLRYAHLYYRDGLEREGGLEFPGGHHPAYIDFAYFAFTIGMCFQVSDVTISNPALRRTALGHAMLAFGYNTIILAVAINIGIGIFD